MIHMLVEVRARSAFFHTSIIAFASLCVFCCLVLVLTSNSLSLLLAGSLKGRRRRKKKKRKRVHSKLYSDSGSLLPLADSWFDFPRHYCSLNFLHLYTFFLLVCR